MIFCFSGTGNTRWAAEYLAKHIGERLLFIHDEMKGDCRYILSKDEIIGFCFPVHGWQPPKIVRRFIAGLSIENSNGHYCFALCTCGDNVGETMTILNRDLEKRGLRAMSTFSVIMPETYVCLPFMYTDTKHREREKIAAAKTTLQGIAQAVMHRQEGLNMLTKGPIPWLYSYVIGGYFNKRMITDSPFRVGDSCINCGLCAEVCPTENIIGGKGARPQWKHDGSCTCCLACYHHCPKHAINYGRRTERRGQYYFKETTKQ